MAAPKTASTAAPEDVLDSIPPELCVQCKAARGLCGIDPCPLLRRVQHHLPKRRSPGKDLWGSSPPSLFVGRHGYPHVGVGPMLPPEHLEDDRAAYLDAPGRWMDDLRIPDVVGLRSSLLRTTHKVRVDRDAMDGDRITRLSQELAVAARPVDTEVHLRKAPRFDAAHVAEFTAPHGPVVEVERATLGENVRVERRMEAVTSDTDLRASEGLVDLYRSGTDPYRLERVLSAGMLGTGRRRRLVPTRWAITATDDSLGKALAGEVRDLPTLDKPTVHQGGGFGNRFLILLLPRVWGFDFVEVWLKGAFWVRRPADAVEGPSQPDRGDARAGLAGPAAVPGNDWEDFEGRTEYAHDTTGGYYAARLPVLEHLKAIGRQATAIVVREITDEYTTPLGVWVVREACRRALAEPGLAFEDRASALRHMDRHATWKPWQAHAGLLERIRAQRVLDDYR